MSLTYCKYERGDWERRGLKRQNAEPMVGKPVWRFRWLQSNGKVET